MHPSQRFIAAGLLLFLAGCATVEPQRGTPHPQCEPHRLEIDPAIEGGTSVHRTSVNPPDGGPRTGYVCVHVTLNSEGRAVDPEIRATDNPAFAAAFLRSISEWRFEPPTRDGEPTEIRISLSSSYRRIR